MPQEEESMNYFSTYEDEIIGVELEDEEISEKPRIKEYIADLFQMSAMSSSHFNDRKLLILCFWMLGRKF